MMVLENWSCDDGVVNFRWLTWSSNFLQMIRSLNSMQETCGDVQALAGRKVATSGTGKAVAMLNLTTSATRIRTPGWSA